MLITEGSDFDATANENNMSCWGGMDGSSKTNVRPIRAGASVRIVRGWGWRACSLSRTKDLKWGQTRFLTGNMRKGGNKENIRNADLVQVE